jgi:2-keto-3-deoxy-L-rhamnonate aldolase RhmA
VERTNLRDALRSGNGSLLFTFLMVPRVEIVEMLGLAGFDGVVIDLEHGPATVGDLPVLSAAARGSGMYAIARVREGTPAEIGVFLDTGVDGVLVPHVSTAAQAASVVAAGRFPPAGDRSLNPYVRGTHYGSDGDAARDLANARSAIIVMVEGAEGLQNLEAIGETDDLDAIFIGPVDLSASLGVPGQPEHPKVIETVTSIFSRLRERKVAAGIFAPTSEAAKRWRDSGAALVALSADAKMMQDAFVRMRAELDT